MREVNDRHNGQVWHKTVEIHADHLVIRTPLGVHDVWFRIEIEPDKYVQGPGYYLLGSWYFKSGWAEGDHSDKILEEPPTWWRDLAESEKYVHEHKRTQDDPKNTH